MDAEEGSERLKQVFSLRLTKWGSQAEASRRLGKHQTYLNDQIRSDAGVRARDHLEALRILGCPLPQEVFHEALYSLETDPAGMLEFSREFQKLPMDPFLLELKPRLEALAVAGAAAERAPAGEDSSRLPEVQQLDLLRRRDRNQAKENLEQLLQAMLVELEAGEPKSRQGLAELTCALGVLAAIYRLAGRRDDAMDVLLPAWPLARLAHTPRSKAEWYQKAAYLLVDLANNTRAYHFLLEAHRLYDLAGAEGCRLRTLVDTAYVLTHAGYHEQSRELLESLLTRLPEADFEYRLSAHQILGENFQAAGDLVAACKQLDIAIGLVGEDLLARASCLWRRGKLLVLLADTPSALASFAEAMPLHATLTGAAELAELGMEYAEVLLKEGRRPELRLLAADLAGWLDQLKANLKLRAAIADFHSLIELDELNSVNLEKIIEAIRVAKIHWRRRVGPRQPPGG